MDTKQKKQLITISLAGAVLLAGLVAGFLVVQNGVFIQNKASEGRISCIPLKGTCTAPAGYSIVVKEEGGSGRTLTGAGTINFDAYPRLKYTCEAISLTDVNCKSSTDMIAPICVSTDTEVTPVAPTVPPVLPKPSDLPTPTVPARTNVPSTTTVPLVTTTVAPSTVVTPTTKTPTATPTTKPGTPTATGTIPTGTGGSGITPTSLPTTAPTATAAAQATKTAATATQAAVQTAATNPSATAAKSVSLPASGNVHPALILGILSVFVIMLGLLF